MTDHQFDVLRACIALALAVYVTPTASRQKLLDLSMTTAGLSGANPVNYFDPDTLTDARQCLDALRKEQQRSNSATE